MNENKEENEVEDETESPSEEVENEEVEDEGEEESDDTEEEDEEEAEHLCGVLILMNRNGNGVSINPVPTEGGNVERIATPDDLLMMINLAKVHMDSNVNAAKCVNAIMGLGKKAKKRGIYVPGRQ
jgi:hypothetical protein